MENTRKARRGKNFTPNERMKIVELVTSSPVLMSKFTGGPGYTITAKLKEAAWERVLTDMNSVGSPQRYVIYSVKCCYVFKLNAMNTLVKLIVILYLNSVIY